MFEYLDFYKQFIRLRNENSMLKLKLEKTIADIEYLAMMTDIELEDPMAVDEVEISDSDVE